MVLFVLFLKQKKKSKNSRSKGKRTHSCHAISSIDARWTLSQNTTQE
jgi:hypothetical protein